VERFDAAIVGAGPAGSAAAIFLARRGYAVALLDKSLFPREKLCGDFLGPANWEIFRKLDIQDALLSLEHQKVESFRISTSSDVAAIPFPPQDARYSFGLGLRRSLFDDLLLRLADNEGVAVRQGCKLSHLMREGTSWSIILDDSSAEAKFHSTLLIGADGRNSWVAHRLGVASPGEKSGKFIAFQLHLRGCKNIDGAVHIHLFPGGYAGLVGLGGDTANLCFTVEKRKVSECPTVDSLLDKYLYRNPHLREALSASKRVGDVRAVYPVYFPPRRCYGDGFLLVGDAARVTEPVTGEGVYFALKTGELAADVADLAFQEGNLSAWQLASYDVVCRKALAWRQRINGLTRAVIYRPHLLTTLVRLSSKSNFPISALVNRVCQTTR
jgi:geranylgeranyl reductase family protein